MSGSPNRLLLIDESDDIVHGGRKYVVACAVVLAGDAQAVGARLRHVLTANPGRTGLDRSTGRPKGPSCGGR